MLVKDNPQTTMDLKRIDWGRQADMAILSEVPYRDGGNCIFFATQEAHEYFFDGAGFGEDEFSRFRTAIDNLEKFEEERTGGVGVPGIGIALTVDFMVPYLHEKYIDVKEIFLPGGKDNKITKIYPEVSGFPFVDSVTSDGYEYPFFVICEGDGGLHTFFVRDEEDFGKKQPVHMTDYPDIVAIMTVEKAREQ